MHALEAEELAEIAKERAIDLKQRGQVVLEEQKSKIETAIDSTKKKSSTKAKKAEKTGRRRPPLKLTHRANIPATIFRPHSFGV